MHEVFAEKQQIIRKSGLLEYYAAGRENFRGGRAGGSQGMAAETGGGLYRRGPRLRAAGAQRASCCWACRAAARACAPRRSRSLWQLPLLRFDMGRMFSSLVGSSEENVRRAISVAESVAPAVLWVDEIDKAFVGSQGSGATDGGTTARVFGTFLTWLSEKTAPVFVVATANDISQLPPELLRKGRLDEIFFVDLPSEEERAEIFRIHLSRRGRDPEDFDLPALVAASEDFSGAEIEEAIISALYDAFYREGGVGNPARPRGAGPDGAAR